MKNLAAVFFLAAVATTAPALADGVTRLSEPVQTGDGYEVFGAPVGAVGAVGEAQPLAQIVAAGEKYAGQEVHAKATVSQVCRKKGCFLVAQDGAAVARVTFVDYSFFVPTDSGGKDVTIIGVFNRKTISEAQARHFAEDAGEDPAKVSGARDEYSIVATSVVIPTS
jgi:hypothetical protein